MHNGTPFADSRLSPALTDDGTITYGLQKVQKSDAGLWTCQADADVFRLYVVNGESPPAVWMPARVTVIEGRPARVCVHLSYDGAPVSSYLVKSRSSRVVQSRKDFVDGLKKVCFMWTARPSKLEGSYKVWLKVENVDLTIVSNSSVSVWLIRKPVIENVRIRSRGTATIVNVSFRLSDSLTTYSSVTGVNLDVTDWNDPTQNATTYFFETSFGGKEAQFSLNLSSMCGDYGLKVQPLTINHTLPGDWTNLRNFTTGYSLQTDAVLTWLPFHDEDIAALWYQGDTLPACFSVGDDALVDFLCGKIATKIDSMNDSATNTTFWNVGNGTECPRKIFGDCGDSLSFFPRSLCVLPPFTPSRPYPAYNSPTDVSKPPSFSDVEIGLTAGAVLTLVLLLVGIYYCCCRKRNDRKRRCQRERERSSSIETPSVSLEAKEEAVDPPGSNVGLNHQATEQIDAIEDLKDEFRKSSKTTSKTTSV